MEVDYRSYTVLYVDDDRANLVALQYALEDTFRIEVTDDPRVALERLASEPIAVLLADHRMPGMTGVELCERARTTSPDTARIIVTAYADVHAAIDAVNRGQVMRYLQKPITNEELEEVLRAAIEAVHATETIRELRSRILGAGGDIGSRSVSAAAARSLEAPATALDRAVDYGRDLLRVYHRADSDVRRAEILGELERTFGELKEISLELEALQRRLAYREQGETREPLDLARIAHGAARLLRPQLPQTTELHLVLEGVEPILGTATALAQVVTNLVLNAAEATAESDRAQIRIEVRERGGSVQVSVCDDGPGVPEDLHERIFDPYFTTTPGRRGLGLAIARRLVEEASGTLTLEPRTCGACFTASFPILTEAPAVPEAT